MTKKRKIELWKMVLNEIETGNHEGICYAISSLWLDCLINRCDRDILMADLEKYRPKKTYNGAYYFEPFLKEPRIKLIKKIISDLND